MTVCTLTISNSLEAEFEDDINHRRSDNRHVGGALGGTPLERETVLTLNRLVRDYDGCSRRELTILGRYLYRIAFGDDEPGGESPPLRAAFEDTYGAYLRMRNDDTPRMTLRLVIHKDADELGTFPWEFLCVPQSQGRYVFLAEDDSELILTRHVPGAEIYDKAPEQTEESLKILIAVSQPSGGARRAVSADELISYVKRLESDRVSVIECDATRRDLRDTIGRERPHIVHLIGHGRPGAIALRLTDDEISHERARLEREFSPGAARTPVDEADWIDSGTVGTLLRAGLKSGERPGRLIFLHACDGATPDRSAESLAGFASVASELAEHDNVAAVIAMQYPITNGDAETFATTFYQSIRDGEGIEQAVSRSRSELGIRSRGGGERRRQSWNDRGFGTPIIYVRNVGPIFRPGGASQHARRRCPNRCGAFVEGDSGTCPTCRTPYVLCPVNKDGLVAMVAGGECTACEYRIGGPAPAASASPATGIDGVRAATERAHHAAASARAEVAGARPVTAQVRLDDRMGDGSIEPPDGGHPFGEDSNGVAHD
jgi:hypothetical protein